MFIIIISHLFISNAAHCFNSIHLISCSLLCFSFSCCCCHKSHVAYTRFLVLLSNRSTAIQISCETSDGSSSTFDIRLRTEVALKLRLVLLPVSAYVFHFSLSLARSLAACVCVTVRISASCTVAAFVSSFV